MASGRKCLVTAMAGDARGDGSIPSQTRQVVSLLRRWLIDLITLH